ncbi:MAG: putative transcriptional regulator [Paenibacillaceae bacterium]|jgi:AcrR family transcriptional regulator|nr:putative transcriptional regulator [Paenibacillaceae bacterium]
MPKIVDHTQKKLEIAEAAWRVIKQKGIKGASVRNIAHETGLSLGALRHYFPGQDDLLVFAMQVVKDRVTARIQEMRLSDLPPVSKVLHILLEMVPTDEDKRLEMEVWFEFTFHMRKSNPAAFNAQHDGICEGIGRLLAYLAKEGALQEELDLELETERLYAVLDGLALHMLLDQAQLCSRRAQDVLERHLHSICRCVTKPG